MANQEESASSDDGNGATNTSLDSHQNFVIDRIQQTTNKADKLANGAQFRGLDHTIDRIGIKPTKRRYIILLLFCLYSAVNALQWIYLSSITNTLARFYQVQNMAINWTSMIYMVVYIPFVVPAIWLFEQIGMRNSILIGSMGTTIGSLMKCFTCHSDGFPLLMCGQSIVAICQLFVLSVPPRLASVWFPDDQVSLANACGVFGNQFGIALGFIIPQLIIGDDNSIANNQYHAYSQISNDSSRYNNIVNQQDLVADGLFNMFLGITIASVIISTLILFLFDDTPAKPPGLARLQQIKQETAIAEAGVMPLVVDESESDTNHKATTINTQKRCEFGALLCELFTDKDFVLLMISYGLNVGVFYAISTCLNQMISQYWVNANTLVGRLGLLLVVSGMIGSVLFGYILDKTRMYRLVNGTLYCSSLVSLIMFTVALEAHRLIALHLTVALLGSFMTGYLFIGYEMSNEITWPRPESVTAGLLNLSAQVNTIAFM